MSDDHRWQEDEDVLVDPEERQVILSVLDSFYQYRRVAHLNATHSRRQKFYALPTEDWQMLASPQFSVLKHLDDVDDAIDTNAELADAILHSALLGFGFPPLHSDEKVKSSPPIWMGTATPLDIDKARSTIHQFYRDWSKEGEIERLPAYRPILGDLAEEFKETPDKSSLSVLVPGAGLGRLVFEICKAGFCTEGNEISYHALTASDFVLNHTRKADQYKLYPFALNFSNQPKRETQLAAVQIPDVHPGTELNEASQTTAVHAFDRMSMAAADFTEIYAKPERKEIFHAVATAFFVDTASNVLVYMRTVHNCLLPGGIWTNVGPLLWHYDENSSRKGGNMPSESHSHGNESTGGVELTWDIIVLLLEQCGFVIEKNEILETPAGYIQNPHSMLQSTYRVGHWLARKRPLNDA